MVFLIGYDFSRDMNAGKEGRSSLRMVCYLAGMKGRISMGIQYRGSIK